MSVSIEDLVRLAEELSRIDGEAYWRCAVSRGYYAAFHACLEVSPNHIRNARANLHEKLITWMREGRESDDETKLQIAEVGLELDQLRKKRAQADYRLREPVHRTDSMLCVKKSAKIIDVIKSLDSGLI
ncbi:MAG: hypothetical protein RE468_04500 [Acidithiobacillus caldus]|uniref:hypothetical protein n=1 Tax=Acidithiobacillus caldus TaxID=33059 RepID=UPI0028161FD5|nr:hypothetical protein [Acidithiobacillus caldus]WMT47878.1 MAG: hypothetical protein RE468_04500 [Acidithiobacillus caldus]